MHRTYPYLAPVLLAMALAACSADRPETAATTTQAPGTTPASEAPAPAADVTMRYTCDGNHTVAVHGESSVSVTTADGTTALPRVADSSPPQFANDTLSFSINAKGAELGHAGVGSFACRPD